MKIDYDADTDILMIELSEENIDHAEQMENIIVHLSKDNKPALLEILDVSDFLPKLTKVTEEPQSKEIIKPSA